METKEEVGLASDSRSLFLTAYVQFFVAGQSFPLHLKSYDLNNKSIGIDGVEAVFGALKHAHFSELFLNSNV